MTRWICSGPVRGDCGTFHRTFEAAYKHCRVDDRAVKRSHGPDAYTDRFPEGVPAMPDVLMAAADVADLAGVTRFTVGRWARAGVLAPVTRAPGAAGAYVFARADVDRFLAERAARAARMFRVTVEAIDEDPTTPDADDDAQPAAPQAYIVRGNEGGVRHYFAAGTVVYRIEGVGYYSTDPAHLRSVDSTHQFICDCDVEPAGEQE